MTTTLTNKHVKTFDDILKTYYNSFLKDIPQKNILAELNNITALSSMNIDCVNVLFGCMLCSKPSGTSISAMECQTVLTSLINRLRPIIQASAP